MSSFTEKETLPALEPSKAMAFGLQSPTALEQLVEEVAFYRNKGLRRASKAEGDFCVSIIVSVDPHVF